MAGNAERIPLTRGMFATVDRADLARVSGYSWWVAEDKNTFYAQATVGETIIRMHHLFLPPRPGFLIDHIDRDGLNNTRANLRYVTYQQNGWNAGKRWDSASPYKGITFHARTGRWQAQIWHQGRNHSLGYYDSAEDAARAYDAKARELRGEFAYLNFPEEADQIGPASGGRG